MLPVVKFVAGVTVTVARESAAVVVYAAKAGNVLPAGIDTVYVVCAALNAGTNVTPVTVNDAN